MSKYAVQEDSAHSSWVRSIGKCWPAFAILLLLGLVFYTCTSLDDIFLAYWPAHTLQNYSQILNYNGQHLEQSSSIVHVVLLAVLAKVTNLPLPVLGYYIAVFFGLLTLVGVYRFFAISGGEKLGLTAALLLGSVPYFVYYSFNSLEAPLIAFLIILVITNLNQYFANGKRLFSSFVSISLFLLARPESFLLLIIPLLVLLLLQWCPPLNSAIGSPAKKHRILKIVAIALAETLLIGGLRYLYFGDYLPQTVRTKVTGLSVARLQRGFRYLFGGTTSLGPDGTITVWSFCFGIIMLGVLLFYGLVWLKEHRKKADPAIEAAFPFLFCLSYFAYLTLVGGDWMEAGRFMVPVLPIVLGFTSILVYRYAKGCRTAVILLLILFNGVGNYYFATRISRGNPLLAADMRKAKIDPELAGMISKYSWVEVVSRGHLRDIPVIAAIENVILNQTGLRPLSLMSHQGGMINYYIAKRFFGRVEFVDLAGLFSNQVSKCPKYIDIAAFQSPFNTGTIVPWDFYFSHKGQLISCGIPEPDIVVDLYFDDAIFPILKEHGYEVVFKSSGWIRGKTFLSSDYGPASEFVAVKRDLVPSKGEFPVLWDWQEKWQ